MHKPHSDALQNSLDDPDRACAAASALPPETACATACATAGEAGGGDAAAGPYKLVAAEAAAVAAAPLDWPARVIA